MGGITRSLFGGSKSTQSSGNNAFEQIKGLMSGNVGAGNNAFSTMSALLGLGGDKAAADGAFKNYLDSSGYNFMMDSGSKAITGNAASKGLLQSGSTGKALTEFGQNLGKTKFDDFLGQLGGLFKGGLDSAGLIANTGQYSKGKSTSSGGIVNSLFG